MRSFLLACCFLPSVLLAQESFTIPNPLKLDWPGELVHLDVPSASGPLSVEIDGEKRPAQIEKTSDGKTRVWFIATLAGGKKGDESKEVLLVKGSTDSPLAQRKDGDTIVVSNGVYDFRVPAPNLKAPVAAKDAPPVLGGIRLEGGKDWRGRAWFEGDATVESITTRVLVEGPVFVDIEIAYAFEGGESYTATLRFVAGDPWIAVTESTDIAEGTLEYFWELNEGIDTAMWIRWFGYENFGGNTNMNYVPLEPQPGQRGPFVALRPRWNQMPGGGQDFLVTSSGATPGKKTENSKYDPQAPAFGVVATHPMLWENPYAQTIRVYAENGDTARMKFPIAAGTRSYAVLAGPRELFDTTSNLNSIVRRHADWTLDDQMHKYVLEWKRDPSKAGPSILLDESTLKKLQSDFAGKKDTPVMKVLRDRLKSGDELKGVEKDLVALIQGEDVKPPRLPDASLWLGRRYQDDFLNPTSRAVRQLDDQFALADLFSSGEPIGGASQAALGYIFTDLDQWPGYEIGWGPGNPNFHTDKYMVAAFAGAALRDHPDSDEWLNFALENFKDDQERTLLAPDGVGYECPGYSGYALHLQLEIGSLFNNIGFANPVADNPLYKKTGRWHRNLLTPFDARLGLRHEAPIGDTHRWVSGAKEAFGQLAKFFKESDPEFASEMMGTYQLVSEQGVETPLLTELVMIDHGIPATSVDNMDWGSADYYGFGSIMRTRFGQPDETFVSLKAGPARGHYHNDELSYHFYGAGTPLSLDYNCSYHPRGDHAALHNSMTFGVQRPFTHEGDSGEVPAMEQIQATARVGGFETTPVADVIVAERTDETLTLSPIYPEDAKFQYHYPTREAAVPITHRRFLMLVKHPEKSPLADYLVVRDETRSADRQHLNIHLLARDVKRDGQIIRAEGQWDTDAVVFLANPDINDFEVGRWYYFDEHMSGPDKWPRKDGKKIVPEDQKELEAWHAKIKETDGEALIPPKGWKGKWLAGEYQKWVRVETGPNTPMLWVLYPQKQGTKEPTFTALAGGTGVRVELDGESEEVYLNSDPAPGIPGVAVVKRDGQETVLLGSDPLPPLGEMTSYKAPEGGDPEEHTDDASL